MADSKGVDAGSKLGRAMFSLVDCSRKMPVDVRTRVIRVRNLIEANPEDPMTRFKIKSDLDALMRESRLNPIVRALWKAMPS